MQAHVEALCLSLTSALVARPAQQQLAADSPDAGAAAAPVAVSAPGMVPSPFSTLSSKPAPLPGDLDALVLHGVIGKGLTGSVLRGTQWGLDCAVKVREWVTHHGSHGRTCHHGSHGHG